jgi:hypothetical protein
MANKQYLFVGPNNRWYLTPITTLSWDWSEYQELTGAYGYCDGTAIGTFTCNGGEDGEFGVGCSNGSDTNFKALPIYDFDMTLGTGTVCQDQPNAFGLVGYLCQENVEMYVHYVQ